MSFTEDNYEKALITLYKNLGYQYLYGPDIARDYYTAFYEEQLVNSLAKINHTKSHSAIDEAIIKLKNIETGSLVQKNELFMDCLLYTSDAADE